MGDDPSREGSTLPDMRQASRRSPTPSPAPATTTAQRNTALTRIEHPGKNDVMFGRGGDTNYHIGNHRFRVLADEHRHQYRTASRKDKTKIVVEVVNRWRAKDPPGRFLARTDLSIGSESLWHDVGDDAAQKKAARILSEKPSEEKTTSTRKRKSSTQHGIGNQSHGKAVLEDSQAQSHAHFAQHARTSAALSSSFRAQQNMSRSSQAGRPIGMAQVEPALSSCQVLPSFTPYGTSLPPNMIAQQQGGNGSIMPQADAGTVEHGSHSRRRQRTSPPVQQDMALQHCFVDMPRVPNIATVRSTVAAKQENNDELQVDSHQGDLPSAATLTRVFDGPPSSDSSRSENHST